MVGAAAEPEAGEYIFWLIEVCEINDILQRFFQAELASRDQYVKDVKNIYHRDIVLNGNSLAAQALHA